MNILINGDFLANNLTGIERCAFESCNNLDMLNKNYKLFILVPKNAKSIPNYKTINVIKINYTIKIRVFWSQVVFPIYALFHNMITFDFANSTPVINPGITVLHDIYCKTHSNDFNSITEKISGVYFRFLYRFISKHAIHIFTVSEFSKTEIIDTYKIPQNKITVMYNGWEYFSKIKPDYAIFDKYPELKNKSFFFCLGSLAKRKNITWISSYAEKHPESLFAISGKRLATLKFTEIEEINKLKNIFMLGYLSDNQVKALMEKSKAFIFPSYYEGFGIPPLEALSTGTKIIVSNIPALKEIYTDYAYFIDPFNSNIDLDKLILITVNDSEALLKKYSFRNTAKTINKELEVLFNEK